MNVRCIRDNFAEFHAANPHVYVQLVRWARRLRQRGHQRCGIAMLFEVLRWQNMMTHDPNTQFKLNNDYRALYAREIMRLEPDLAGFFQTRTTYAS